ncbi:MAG: hypothetical protein AB7Q23_04280 [Hyphomonadaceae bacterium]
MTIGDRIPDLSDQELESLHANAVRLLGSGSVQQRRQAEELLPLLDAALEERRTAKAAAQVEARRAATEKRTTAKRDSKTE